MPLYVKVGDAAPLSGEELTKVANSLQEVLLDTLRATCPPVAVTLLVSSGEETQMCSSMDGDSVLEQLKDGINALQAARIAMSEARSDDTVLN